MSKHTAGPWRAVNDGPFIATEHNTVIAKIVCNSNEGNVLNCQTGTPADFETIANARLIAAAPELLEACQYVIDWHREHDSGEGELFGLDFVTTCINATRKAQGL